MKARPFFHSVVLILIVCNPSAFASVASVEVTAQYGSLPVDSVADSTSSLILPAEAHAFSEFELGGFGQSDAKAYLDGRVESFSSGLGAYGHPIYAQSQAASSADWLVHSDTLPVGTPVRVWLDVVFEGRLFSMNSELISSTQASLKLDGDEIYSGSASFAKPDLTAEGNWSGNLTQDGSSAYNLNLPNTLIFDTAVGETINLTLFLRTEIDCGPTWETGASADFSSTGFYTFVGAYDLEIPPHSLNVNFILIPEPFSILLLAAGGLLVRKQN